MAAVDLKPFLADHGVWATAPCRIDMGGTLDIKTFYYPLAYLAPATVNFGLNLRTRVRLFPHDNSGIKISSRGFESAEFPLGKAPFRHPLGLMFAVADYFRVSGVHIDIPPPLPREAPWAVPPWRPLPSSQPSPVPAKKQATAVP